MIEVYDGYDAGKGPITMKDKGLTDTIHRVLGTFIGKELRVEVLSEQREAVLRKGTLDGINVTSVEDRQEKYDALSLVLRTAEGLKAVLMGHRPCETRVARVFVSNPHDGVEEARYFRNIPVAEEYDELREEQELDGLNLGGGMGCALAPFS